MASPHDNQNSKPSAPNQAAAGQSISFADSSRPARSAAASAPPDASTHSLEASTATLASGDGVAAHRKGKRRGGRKRRNRRQSFAATVEDTAEEDERPNLASTSGRSRTDEDRIRGHNMYRIGAGQRRSESLDSEQALLDHRDQTSQRTRRQSVTGGLKAPSGPSSSRAHGSRQPPSPMPRHGVSESNDRSRLSASYNNFDGDNDLYNDYSPLIKARRGAPVRSPNTERAYGSTSYFEGPSSAGSQKAKRRSSRTSSRSSKQHRSTVFERQQSSESLASNFDVNNPPSRPSSPMLEEANAYDEVMLRNHGDVHGRSPENGRRAGVMREMLIDIDEHADEGEAHLGSTPPSPSRSPVGRGRQPNMTPAEGDVCFPQEGMSEMGEDDFSRISEMDSGRRRRNRRRRGAWPDLSVLEEWGVMEKEERTMEGIRSRRVHEPILVGGRLRPSNNVWHREEEDTLRFTYFNEEFDNTLHASTLSELLQDGTTFRNLFIPDPPELSDSDTDDEDDITQRGPDAASARRMLSPTSTANSNGHSRQESANKEPVSISRPPSILEKFPPAEVPEDPAPQASPAPTENTARASTPTPALGQTIAKRKRYGPRPIWWLDVLCPTDAEIRVIGKAFGIHPLTQEDIVTQEPREKIEMFKHYYFMNYRTFEQDSNSENYLEPMNFYTVVFAEGVLTFHFSQTPHPANVRRRVRVLTDYLMPTSDWVSYAIIDNITDVYVPLIQKVEDEVDNIDEAILGMHSTPENSSSKTPATVRYAKKARTWKSNPLVSWMFSGQQDRYNYQALETEEEEEDEKRGVDFSNDDTSDMLRRTGECRKKVMGLYRLLGNKADVIKGFAKRCNEQWDVAPRSEIGLYLGDIQDHIVTMTGNLSHYENLLSRAHSNYLAQINIRMNERAERTNDILGKLTVVGTIVLPMNIVTGLWGMNCIVPGQEVENLNWFYALSAFLVLYAVISYWVAKKVYGIV